MPYIDLGIFAGYMLLMLGVGYYFMGKNKSQDDYYVGGRGIGSWHIGLSVVATDVGGGFSVGLGGLGFIMGLSGSWMLFTGLLGAWLAAVFLIPRVKQDPAFASFYTFPQIFQYLFNKQVAIVAAVICLLGYLGFTSSQLLAGAKLASGTFPTLEMDHALWIMGAIAVIYTVMGGLKAVIYTDTIQWIILMMGFIFIGLPIAYFYVGGWDTIQETLPKEFFNLNNLVWQDLVNWGITILPIWFIGMTLYQRIFASRDVKSARKAWFIAGVFEWPIMAFMGVSLGLLARVAFEQGLLFVTMDNMDPEMGLPILLRTVLPPGILGLMMAAYFSAVLSTADSCLMAASGNLTTDIFGKFMRKESEKTRILLSQMFTLILGGMALILALQMENVLELMLYSYAFMVSGLLVPVLFGLFTEKRDSYAAMAAMLTGGSVTASLSFFSIEMILNLDPNLFGILSSLGIYLLVYQYRKSKNSKKQEYGENRNTIRN
jgi:solute:Na+ symporter, SSS family